MQNTFELAKELGYLSTLWGLVVSFLGTYVIYGMVVLGEYQDGEG